MSETSHLAPSNQIQVSPTPESYGELFRAKYFPRWQESPCLQNITRIFEQSILTSKDITITKCVCLGLGSLTADFNMDTSSYEFAAFISMVDLLRKSSKVIWHHLGCCEYIYCTYAKQVSGRKHSITDIFFQDPVFNPVDKAFLNSCGFWVRDDPQAFCDIDNNTFLFAPHLDLVHFATALENKAPSLCIGNSLEDFLNDP